MVTQTEIALMYVVLAASLFGVAFFIWFRSRAAHQQTPFRTYFMLAILVFMGLLNLWTGIRHL